MAEEPTNEEELEYEEPGEEQFPYEKSRFSRTMPLGTIPEELAEESVDLLSVFGLSPRQFCDHEGMISEEGEIRKELEQQYQTLTERLKPKKSKFLPPTLKRESIDAFRNITEIYNKLINCNLVDYVYSLNIYTSPPSELRDWLDFLIPLLHENDERIDQIVTAAETEIESYKSELFDKDDILATEMSVSNELSDQLMDVKDRADYLSAEFNGYIRALRDHGKYDKGLALCEMLLVVDPDNFHRL